MPRGSKDDGRRPPRRPRRGTAAPTIPLIAPDGRFRPILAKGEALAFDIDPAGGGGEPWHPRSFNEARAVLAPQARRVAEQVSTLPDRLRGRHVIFEAKLLPNYVAGSHYPSHLLEYAQLYPVGSRQSRGTYTTKRRVRENEPTKTYLLAGDDAAVERLARVIADGPDAAPKEVWKDIREFDLMELPAPTSVIRAMPEDAGDGELVTWEAVLSSVGSTDTERARFTEEVLEKFIRYIETLRGDVDRAFIRQVDGLLFVPIALTTQDVVEAAAFNALRALRPMPRVRDLDTVLRAAPEGAPGAAVQATDPVLPPRTAERIAVFDGGIDQTDPVIAPYVRIHPITTTSMARFIRHGTMVTNAALFGYEAAEADGTRAPVALVDHYQVLPPPSTGGVVDTDFYWVLDQIEKYTVEHGHQLVNLSLGPPKCVDDDAEPHAWTARLDKLSREHGILFICAVGNNGASAQSRICVPADMANGLAVGACRSRDPAAPLRRASYSAIGPGRAGQRVAPLGVAFGGSIADSAPFRARGRGGRPDECEGTSYATPLVSHGLAEVRAMLDAPRPDTLRAFAAHFAQGEPARGQDARHTGHGRLRESYRDIWDCGPNAVTALYDLTLRKGTLRALPLPMPSGVRDDAEVRIVFTVCYTSAVQAQHAPDYTRAGVHLTFRPHDQMFGASDVAVRPHKRLGDFHIERDRDALADLGRRHSLKLSDHPLPKSGWRRTRWEGDQRDAGKWDTLVRADWRFAARELHGPRLDLEYHARDGVQLTRTNVPDLPVTVLVTVEGPGDVPIYDLVEQQLEALAGLVEIDVDTSTPIRVRSSDGS